MRYLFLLLFSSIFSILFSQNPTHPAFIITNKGDSLKGHVIKINHKKCVFSSVLNETITFTASEIKQVFSGTELYLTIKQVSDSGKINFYFSNVILQGYLTLIDSKDLFILKKQNDTIEYYLKNNTKYKGILSYIMNDCPQLKSQIETTSYTKNSITDLVKKYNSCKNSISIIFNEESEEILTKKKYYTKIGIYTGFNTSKMDIISPFEDFRVLTESVKNAKTTQTFGFTSNIHLFHRLYINPGLAYTSFLYTTKINYKDINKYTYPIFGEKCSINTKYIVLPIGFTYDFFNSNLTPYLNVSLTNFFLLNGEAKRNFYLSPENNPEIVTFDFFSFKKINQGILSKLGISYSYKHSYLFFTEVGIEKTLEIMNPLDELYPYIQINTLNFYFQFGLKLML